MPSTDLESCRRAARAIEANVRTVVRGEAAPVRLALVALFARGHLLIEDVPGTGKTVLARAIARSLDASFRRIQCTQDLLPSDITGVSVYDPGERAFSFREGPVFTEVLLTDEVNRATPRAQSALLECMEERQVTCDGETRPLSPTFFVVATQNPVELEGTFPLPEAQLDRFALRLSMGYPARADLCELLLTQRGPHPLEALGPVASPAQLQGIQAAAEGVAVHPSLAGYIADLVAATRTADGVVLGASPRAAIWLLRAARAHAFLEGRDLLLPDDVQEVAPAVLGHRILMDARAHLARRDGRDVVTEVLRAVDVPLVPTDAEP